MDISPAFGHPKWENVVIFASEMLESPDKLISSMIEIDALFIASKCAGNASLGIKEELCALLADELDSRFEIEKTEAIKSIGRLGNIGISLLIEALHDENDNVHRSAAYALGEICTTVNVEMLKDLMNSDNAFEANTGFNILREFNKREYSELELFQKIKKSFGKEQSAQQIKRGCSEARPAEEGMTDPYMKIYVDKLISITEPRTILDYGCGNGKLLCAMKKIPSLKNISYIGIDNKSACRFRARLTAEKYGFFKSMGNQPEFLKPQDFFGKELLADYVFMMHTMHELRLVDLVDVIYHNSAKLKPGGWIYILDQRILVKKERDFVLWDTEKDLKTLFSDSGFESSWLPMDTGKNHKLCSVAAQKVKNDCFPKDKVAENCRAVYESKKERLLRKRKSEEGNIGSLDSEIANITEQLDEYDKKIQK